VRIASGTVLDRPWGQTLGAIGMRKLDAQVTVSSDDGKSYAIAFMGGAVVAASSALPNDSVTRVALTSHFVSPMQVNEITRRLSQGRDQDEVAIVAEAGKLSPEHTATLRRRLIIQRAARTFSVDRATFEIDDRITLRAVPGFAISLGAVIFHGVRMNLSEQRLVEDMRELGTSFHLKVTTTDADLAQYELEGDTRSVIAALRKGTSLAELELASHRDLEPRTLQAMLYALVCGGHCETAGGQSVDRTVPPAPRTSTGLVSVAGLAQHQTQPPPLQSPSVTTPPPSIPPPTRHRITVDQPLVTRTRTTHAPATMPRTLTPVSEVLPQLARTNTPPTPPEPSRTEPPPLPPAPRSTMSPPFTSRQTPPTGTPRTATTTLSPTPRTPGNTLPPGARTPTQPPATRTMTKTGGFVSRTTTPPTGAPPLRSATMPPPRSSTATGSPLDEFIKETTTSRGFANLAEGTPGTGPYPLVDEFGRESTTNRGITVPPTASRTITAPRTITERDRARKEIEVLIASRLTKLEAACDYFAILGLPFEAPLDAVRNNYVETSRRLHPDSLSAVGITDDTRAAARILAQVNAAFSILSDAQKRREYVHAVRRGEPTPITPRARTGELDSKELAAEAFSAGMAALKRDDIMRAVEELGKAANLVPANLEYTAMYAWATFCASTDKQATYADTRKALEKAIHRGEKPVAARFYLGRVERMVGHDREAFNHFQEVLLDEPNNREAASELRIIEQRLARGTKPKR
jgi:DnaJ domain